MSASSWSWTRIHFNTLFVRSSQISLLVQATTFILACITQSVYTTTMRHEGTTKKVKGRNAKKNTNIWIATRKVSKIPTHYGAPRFITVLTNAHHWSVSWVRWFHSPSSCLGELARLRKATISFVTYVLPSIRLCVCPPARNNSALARRISMKFDMSIFQKFVEKIQVSLNSDANNGYFTWIAMNIYDTISLNSSQD